MKTSKVETFRNYQFSVLLTIIGILTTLVMSWMIILERFPYLPLHRSKLIPQSQVNVISKRNDSQKQFQCQPTTNCINPKKSGHSVSGN